MSDTILLYLKEDDKTLIDTTARENRLSTSSYIRSLVLKEIMKNKENQNAN